MQNIQSVKQRFGIIGTSEKMNSALEVALRVAPTDLTVLVTGESGVGKEFFPRVIHDHSPRKHGKYVAVNCGAIPEGTIDSELFGHEKGAFTGAIEARKGYFEEANGGTIFLDEVAELPLSTQVRLLRVLQTGEFIRVGSSKPQKTDVRVVAATNKPLTDATAAGRFREDLYYRLNTVPIAVPPLRERRGDIYLLFRRFASDIANRYRMPMVSLDEGAREVLESYSWPGNVRQLKNVAEQISAVEATRQITASILLKYLPAEQSPTGAMIFSAGATGAAGAGRSFADEREILYRILFDMRAEIADMRRTLDELCRRSEIYEPFPGEEGPGGKGDFEPGRIVPVAGLLPASAMARAPQTEGAHDPFSTRSHTPFAQSEEVTPDREPTKVEVERENIIQALQKTGGRRKEAAAMLFISERTLYRKIKELEIEV
ncbi:MAG: sigma-54 dependent transcriptional regulator [Alistipes sp.]|nr:sigma-54 dependent transcriptional regulator [Alistipes sp.]